jgi:hypothetical protein
MKPILLALAVPILLTGCAAYVGDYGPGYPGYYDGGYYAGGPVVDVGFYGSDRGGYDHHDYHHYDTASRGTVAYHGSTHASSHAVASVSHASGHAGTSHSASVSSGATHIH